MDGYQRKPYVCLSFNFLIQIFCQWNMFNFGEYAGICHLPLASLKELHFSWLILKFPDLLNNYCPLRGKELIFLAWHMSRTNIVRRSEIQMFFSNTQRLFVRTHTVTRYLLFIRHSSEYAQYSFYPQRMSQHDGRLLRLFLPQLRKFNLWLTEEYFIFQMKQDIKTS